MYQTAFSYNFELTWKRPLHAKLQASIVTIYSLYITIYYFLCYHKLSRINHNCLVFFFVTILHDYDSNKVGNIYYLHSSDQTHERLSDDRKGDLRAEPVSRQPLCPRKQTLTSNNIFQSFLTPPLIKRHILGIN